MFIICKCKYMTKYNIENTMPDQFAYLVIVIMVLVGLVGKLQLYCQATAKSDS